MDAKSHLDGCIAIYSNEEPIAIRVIPSGWNDSYHVIVEFGDYEDSTYKGLFTSEQVKDTYGIEIDKEINIFQIGKKFPNDQELGRAIRELNSKYNKETKI